MIICENCIHKDVCGLEGYYEEALKFCANKIEERPQDEFGKWIITAIQCPNCLAYFHRTDGYSMKKLKECPNCGANMIKEAEE